MRGRVIEYTFFFAALVAVAYLVWLIFAPFISALALSAIIVIICYPLYTFVLKHVTRGNTSLAAMLATIIVVCVVVTPLAFTSSLLVNEFITAYRSIDSSGQLSVDLLAADAELFVQGYIPGFEINFSQQLKESLGWLTSNLGNIFAGTLSAVFTLFIALLGSFYLFRDGHRFVNWLISISPLKNVEDEIIMDRLAQSIRSVATGTVLVAILQGILIATGFAIFGIDRPLLWGTVGAIVALLPGVGTLLIMLPAIAYLFYISDFFASGGLALWALATVAVVDNFISPYLMSRGNNLHPFVILLSVLGGLALFGPLGFILGPVAISLLMVLLQLYSAYASEDTTDNLVPVTVIKPLLAKKNNAAGSEKISQKKLATKSFSSKLKVPVKKLSRSKKTATL